MSLQVGNEHPGDRADLSRAAVVTRGLGPRVLVVVGEPIIRGFRAGVAYRCFAHVGGDTGIITLGVGVPSRGNVLLDFLRVEWMDGGVVAVHDHATLDVSVSRRDWAFSATFVPRASHARRDKCWRGGTNVKIVFINRHDR